jgi:hypothetical protein
MVLTEAATMPTSSHAPVDNWRSAYGCGQGLMLNGNQRQLLTAKWLGRID